MAIARKHQVNLDLTPYYHCIARCVRRSYLCGYDAVTHQNFDHRKQWLVDLMHELSQVFAIRICAYAVMSNHYHLVVCVDRDLALSWSDEEVLNRWADLFPMTDAATWRDLKMDLTKLTPDQQDELNKWRNQLYDISWYMRKLNEWVARRANKEDECTGRFWEARFKSQALLDESALLACMAYVDLNPIRAGICTTPESSDFTSIQERIVAVHNKEDISESLCIFEGSEDEKDESEPVSSVHRLPITQLEYFELVDVTGRLVKANKKGSIPAELAPILQRLKITPSTWCDTVQSLGASFAQFIGRSENIKACLLKLNKVRFHGLKSAKQAFQAA